jgi:Na+/H+ antiporter NhaD/arsenite permease-like protein
MSASPDQHHAPTGFHGPKCWILAALAGLVIGVVVGMLVPAGIAGGTSSHPSADAPRVVQTNPDGTKVERLADGSTVPVGTASSSAVAWTAAPPHSSHVGPDIPLWLCVPFGLLLVSIATMPLFAAKFWHAHYPDVAFFLGSSILGYYLAAMGTHGRHEMLHAGLEYYSFIALVGGLYVASGGILVDVRDRATPMRNTLLLALGAVLANVLGTTGASVLLIRPFMRMNRGRLRAVHVVFFIFIVSNCGGCLTPIGDPPLYLGFLKGVPFAWTLTHMWPMWLLVNGMLLAVFFVMDMRIPAAGADAAAQRIFDPENRSPIVVAGAGPVVCLVLLVAGVFVDPLLKRMGVTALDGWPVGATFQMVMAVLAYRLARPSIHHSNQFTFEPVKEVAFLFAGIFLTMAPALGYLQANAGSLGLETPTQYYFLTGGLSACLDNAPTYLSFLQASTATLHVPMTPVGLGEFISASYELTHADGAKVVFEGQTLLEGIALGAVFFGAMTYIGNGPNFMVKSIVDAAHAEGLKPGASPGQRLLGTAMPSFVGYVVYSVVILLPVLVVNWLVFIR